MYIRLLTTLIIWGGFALTMMTMFITGKGEIYIGQVVLGIVIAMSAFLGTGMVWNWGEVREESHASSATKNKREAKLNALLEKLNEDDLAALRDRLTERTHDDYVYGVGDDGELVKRR